jgi:anti-sigma factor RsiW
MGRADHIAVELLSALADGELDLSVARNAQQHLAACEACATQLAGFGRLDRALAAPAPISCASALDLRSALLDRELSAGEAAVAQAHLASCEPCRAEHAAWTSAETAIRIMPIAFPSEAVDARIARLTAPAPRPRFPLTPSGVSAAAMRAGFAAALVLAIVIGLQPAAPGAPEVAVPAPAPEVAIVASVQQMVLYPRTNTLYVLQTADAAVDAVDAATFALRTRIAVGGRPTALALNLAESQVLVLDAASKSLITIDAERNSVVTTTTVPISGTPTSMQVDATNGKIVVTSAIVAPEGGGGAPSPTPVSSGQVAVIDATTKKLDVVRSVAVAPRLVVSDPSGKGTLFVSTKETTLVDKTYQPLRTLPGGIGAAFGIGGRIAVLGASGGEAILHLIGDGAPAPLRLAGTPQAVTPMPGGGFAVLLGSGSGNGRIVVVDESGRSVASTDVDIVARDFAYDEAAGKFTVVRDGQVSSVAAPLALRPSTAPERSPDLSRAPLVSVAPSASASPSASPSPSGSASPVPSASPSTSPVVALPAPSASPSPSLPAGVPKGATEVARDLYHVALMGGHMPLLWGSGATSVWILDDHSVLTRYDTSTADITQRVQLPLDARVSQLAVGRSSVYALDTASGRLLTVRIADGKITSRSLPLLQLIVAIVPGRDDVLWMALANSSQLLSLDTRTGRVEIADLGMFGVTQLAVDGTGAVWASDADHGLGRYDPATGKFTQVGVPSAGRVSVLLTDPFGSLWVGTTAGEVFKLTGGVSRRMQVIQRPIASLAM